MMVSENGVPSKNSSHGNAAELRQQAEELAQQNQIERTKQPPPQGGAALFHELCVHKIELELQNDELRKAQARLEESQSRYYDLYDMAPVGYLTLDAKGFILNANLCASALLGSPRSLLPGVPFSNWIVPEDQDSHYRHRKALLETGALQRWDMRLRGANSSLVWVHTRADLGPNGEIWLTLTDITDRKQAQEERQEIYRFLHTSKLASLGLLAAGMAHEINNPLAILKGHVQTMLVSADDEQMRQKLEKQEKAIDRITQIVKSLNNYARVDAEAAVPLDVHKSVWETVTLIEPVFKKEQITIDCRLLAPQSTIHANPGYFQQTLMNLLTNARDAFSDGQRNKTIVVESATVSDQLTLRVRDNGCGISPEILEKIFDPFFTTKPAGKGMGIGLSISQSFVTAMQGSLCVTSAPGIGSTFTLTFPLTGTVATPTTAPARAPDPARFHGRVLLVDDDDGVREVLSEFLQRLGLTVIEANDGDIALDIMREDATIQFLITDIKMKRMNGDELIRIIRESDPPHQAKLIAMSGGFSEGAPLTHHDPHTLADGYFAKPCTMETIAAVFSRITAG